MSGLIARHRTWMLINRDISTNTGVFDRVTGYMSKGSEEVRSAAAFAAGM